MAMREFGNVETYRAAIAARGLQYKPFFDGEEIHDYAVGETGQQYGMGANIPNEGDDGCEVGPPDYYAVLFDMPTEFEQYMETAAFWEPRGCPTYGEDAKHEPTPVELLMQALGNHARNAEVAVPEQCATLYIGGRVLHVTVEELPADERSLPAYAPDVEDERTKPRELTNLLNRAAAALETPADLSVSDKEALVEDLVVAARCIEEQADKLARRNVRSTVKLYPLTQEDLHMAEENGGVTEHVQWHEITCTNVWVEAGVPRALYEFWYMGDEGKPEWAQFWLTVRDGKLYGEY